MDFEQIFSSFFSYVYSHAAFSCAFLARIPQKALGKNSNHKPTDNLRR
ncbi:MAG: hypothetical protein AB7T15_01150 [Desulfuromonas sp.]|nr:hypothetical protein [Desulfuromonas thiophila]